MRRGWFVSLIALVAAAPLSPALAQDLNGGVIRGENVWLRSDPADDAEVLGYHQRGESIAITGPAENVNGETKTLTVESLTSSRDWYVPVEISETGEAGWIAELFIDPRGVTVEDVAPAETPVAEPAAGAGNGNGNPNRANRANRQNTNQNPAAEPTSDAAEPSQGAAEPAAGTITPEEQAYVDAVAPILIALGDSTTTFADLASDPKIDNENWRTNVTTEVAVWQSSDTAAQALTPPDGTLGSAHKKLLRSLKLLAEVGDDVNAGLEASDPASITDAVAKLDTANTALQEANDLVTQFREEQGI